MLQRIHRPLVAPQAYGTIQSAAIVTGWMCEHVFSHIDGEQCCDRPVHV